MQDNAPCHKAKICSAFLTRKRVNVIAWPPGSPDMNPIENLWAWIKEKKQKDYPTPKNKDQLEDIIFEIWDSITPEQCAKYCGDYTKRLEALKEAKGDHTKY